MPWDPELPWAIWIFWYFFCLQVWFWGRLKTRIHDWTFVFHNAQSQRDTGWVFWYWFLFLFCLKHILLAWSFWSNQLHSMVVPRGKNPLYAGEEILRSDPCRSHLDVWWEVIITWECFSLLILFGAHEHFVDIKEFGCGQYSEFYPFLTPKTISL